MKNVTTIFGAPGCGKTYALMGVLSDLLKTYSPTDIAFVSFTRAGAYEGRARAMEQFDYKVGDFPYFRTLHSIAFQHAGIKRSDVITEARYKEFSKLVGMSFTGYYTDDMSGSDDQYLFHYFLEKNNPKMASEYRFEGSFRVFEFVRDSYDVYKRERGYVDYTDMLDMFVEDWEALPVKVAIIDEAQDLTTLQWRMCEAAFRNCEKIFVAGDDDQAIYEWNGADVEHFMGLGGERVILDKSYRMPSKVLSFSTQISARINKRIDKKFAPREAGGQVELINGIDSLEFNESETYYLLARNRYYLEKYAEALRKRGLVYTIKGEKSVSETLVKTINAYEYRRREGKFKSDVDKLRVKQVLIDKEYRLPWYDALEMDEDDKDYYRDLVANKTDLSSSNIMVSTIHGVKGGEADNVVLMADMTKRTHHGYQENPDSELRVLYVGASRAKQRLFIMPSEARYGYDDDIPLAKIVNKINRRS